MCVQNLKFVALSVPEVIGSTQKIWAVPVYAHAPFSPKFLIGFCSHGPFEYNISAKFEVRSFPIPEIIGDTSKICGVPGFAHAPHSPKF